MSIGNLKDSGNQGNNFPFQLKVLQGLSIVAEMHKCENLSTVTVSSNDTTNLAQYTADEIANRPSSYLVSQSITYNNIEEIYVALLIFSTI